MRIKEVRLTGFKSFADPTELEFGVGLTGIVGPNGCGKSNIVEGILWAMGETAPSSVRSSEMDDVIFTGGGGRVGRNFAEVALTVDPEGIAVPGEPANTSEVEVVRRITRKAGSLYRINGRDARARDVQTMFGDAGTGARSCAIVQQNRIGELINTKPEGRRRIIEDAAGIAGLHQRRHEAELKINATERNLETAQENIAQLDRQLNALKREATRAGRYRGIAARLRRTEALLALARWRQELSHKAEVESQLATATAEMARASTTANTAARTRAVAGEQVTPYRQKQAEAAAALTRASNEAGDLDRQIAEAESRIAASEASVKQLHGDIERERQLAKDAEANLSNITQADAESQEIDSESIRTALATAEQTEQAAAAAVAEAEQQLDECNLSAAQITARQTQLTAEESEVQTALARLDSELEKLQAESVGAEREQQESTAAIEATRAATAAAQETTEAAKTTTAEAAARREQANASERELRASRDAAAQRATALQAERAALEQLLAESATDAGEPIETKIRIEDGFESALAAAVGDDLQLPEFTDVYQAPDSASGWLELPPLTAPLSLPESVTPLSRHVIAPAALSRRLAQIGLVSPADGARLQSQLQPGQRLVSRDGDLWRWDGLFVAAKHARGDAGRKVAARARLSELTAEIVEANRAANETQAAHAEAEAALATATADEHTAREALRKCEDALAKATNKQINAERGAEVTAARIAAIERERNRAANGKQEIATRLENLRTAVARDADDTETKSRVDAARQRLERLRGEAGTARAECDRLRQKLESIAREKTERENARTAWSQRLTDARQRATELSDRLTATQERLTAERAVPAKISERKSELESVVKELKQTADAAADALAGAERKLREAGETERNAQAELATTRENRARLEAQLEAANERVEDSAHQLRDKAGCEPTDAIDKLKIDAEQIPTPNDLEQEIDKLRTERDRIGPVNLRADADQREIEEARAEIVAQKDDLDQALEKFKQIIIELNAEGRNRLLEAFQRVDGHFREVFTTLFGPEANASLELVDSDDPFEAGLEIYAQPPGKRLLSLAQMSGGEKALTALALIFALFLSSPAPLCVLDEVDAPLDDANVQRFCDLLEQMSRRTEARFLVVTHHAITISRMDRLYGVTMAEKGVSQLVSVDYEDALARVAA